MIKKFLGKRVRDNITGFEGIATARTQWLNGCIRIAIQPTELKDGKTIEEEWFDIRQIKIVKNKVVEPLKKEKHGPARDPKF